MLKILDLKAFLDETKQAIPEITHVKLLSSDDRFARIAGTLKSEDFLLIGLLPSAKPKSGNEDLTTYKNTTAFMIVKKFDSRAGNEHYLDTFITTQTLIMKFEKRIRFLKSDVDSKCTLIDFQLQTLSILPVENYHHTNGWDLSVIAESKS
ncbi:hypothetical protein ACE939_00910 [Aquimarina sp. W85]|uniref:hypothetical protein n=1 Tax=Aquimarina rhodophyticola TaxID=3342246 RepID=UPI00366A821C